MLDKRKSRTVAMIGVWYQLSFLISVVKSYFFMFRRQEKVKMHRMLSRKSNATWQADPNAFFNRHLEEMLNKIGNRLHEDWWFYHFCLVYGIMSRYPILTRWIEHWLGSNRQKPSSHVETSTARKCFPVGIWLWEARLVAISWI